MIAIMTTQDHNEAGYQTTQGIISSGMFLESAASNLSQFTVVQWTYIGTEDQWHWFVMIYGIFSNNTSLITNFTSNILHKRKYNSMNNLDNFIVD